MGSAHGLTKHLLLDALTKPKCVKSGTLILITVACGSTVAAADTDANIQAGNAEVDAPVECTQVQTECTAEQKQAKACCSKGSETEPTDADS